MEKSIPHTDVWHMAGRRPAGQEQSKEKKMGAAKLIFSQRAPIYRSPDHSNIENLPNWLVKWPLFQTLKYHPPRLYLQSPSPWNAHIQPLWGLAEQDTFWSFFQPCGGHLFRLVSAHVVSFVLFNILNITLCSRQSQRGSRFQIGW